MIKIFVVEDHVMFADGLGELANSETDFEVVGHSSSVADSINTILNAQPDVVLLDVHLPDGDGYEIHEFLVKQLGRSAPKIVYISGDDDLAV